MADDFAEHFVGLGGFGFGADGAAEFRLDHGEDGFDVGPLVVVGEEFLAVELEEVPHSPPQGGAGISPRVDFEGDVGS